MLIERAFNSQCGIATINVSRLIVGIVFTLSGFVKAVDPLGAQYKIEEYIKAWGVAEFIPGILTLFVAIIIPAIEFTLGVMLLFAIHRKFVSRIVLVVIIAFTVISFWLVIADPIKDCGCFGDAFKLSNEQTLVKNIVLLIATIFINLHPLAMFRLLNKRNQWTMAIYSAMYIVFISLWSLYHLPLFDFRPYRIGTDIKAKISASEQSLTQFETIMTFEKNGKKKLFTTDNWPDSSWTFVEMTSKQVGKDNNFAIENFYIIRQSDERDITQDILDNPGYTFLLVSTQLKDASISKTAEIDRIYNYAKKYGYGFYCLTASTQRDILQWANTTEANYDFCLSDETTLKTIIRSNPGLVLLKEGKVLRKWSHNDLPSEKQLNDRIENTVLSEVDDTTITQKSAIVLAWFALPLLLFMGFNSRNMRINFIRKKRKFINN